MVISTLVAMLIAASAPAGASPPAVAPAASSPAIALKPSIGTAEAPLVVRTLPLPEGPDDAAAKAFEQKEKPTIERNNSAYARAGLVVNCVLTCFTALMWWQSLRLARDAKAVSQKQAADTIKSLEIARSAAESARASVQAYQRSERAWVTISGVEPEFSSAADNAPLDRHGIQWVFRVTNCGGTPALRCEGALRTLIVHSSSSTDDIDADFVVAPSIVAIPINPGSERRIAQTPPLSPETTGWLAAGTHKMITELRVTYFDVFDDSVQREMKTTIRITGDGTLANGSTRWVYKPIGHATYT